MFSKKMNHKHWLIALFIFIVVQLVALEVFYRTHDYNRHEVDYLVKTKLATLKNKTYETVILGDSLARNAIGVLDVHPHILDLTSNNAVSMAGNYFMFKRYLKENSKPKNLYLFCVPNHLHQNLDTIHTYSYFTTIFTHQDEIKDIEAIKPKLYKNYSFSTYTESRLKSLKFLTHYKPKKKVKAVKIDEKSLIKKENFMNAKIANTIHAAEKAKESINDVPKRYIDKMVTLCKKLDINFTLIIEPIIAQSNEAFVQSKLYTYLQEQKINIYNINDTYTFNNYFFKSDGRHLHGKENQYYQNLIDEHIVDIY